MLEGKVVIVTGGAKGIGRYAAQTLAREGAKLAIADIDTERLHTTLKELRELGTDALAVAANVRHEDEVRRMVDQVATRFGRIDVLVNDAGIVPHFNWGLPRWPRIRFMEKDFWDGVIETNLGGTFLCTKYVLPFMEAERSGHIVNLHGGGGLGACAYAVSKDAIRTFTRYVAEEVKEWNVCVVTIAPGQAIATEDAPEEARRRLPGPDFLKNSFVLAAQADMELTGQLLALKEDRLVTVP
jgi:NAD(P)-dependent dehydrogenase (short-subunit alcohol dehydrogenase family)